MNTHELNNNDSIRESSINSAVSAGQNVQDEPTAESGAAKSAEAAFEHPAGGGSAPSLCSGLQACQATVNWVWIDWDEVACVNGVNNQELATVSQEIEVIFKSGKSLKVCLGQMMGFKNLSDCPLVSREAFEKQILLLEQYSHDLELRK